MMKTPLLRLAIVVAAAAAIPLMSRSQAVGTSARDALLDLLLFPVAPPIDLNAYPPDLRVELQRYLQRYKAYRSKRHRPVMPGLGRGEDDMIYSAWTDFERRLAAVSADPSAPALAEAYVTQMKPCYEWEGGGECPEREAKFAAAYQEAQPRGPFNDYLPFLAAHRWLCAAEGYESEAQPERAAQSRKAYEQTTPAARQSKSLLMRFAAERLAQRKSCSTHP